MQEAPSSRKESPPPADSIVRDSPEDLLKWALNKLKRNEDVAMTDFADQFGFHSEEAAHLLFLEVVGSTNIPYATRTRLARQYEIWRNSKGEEFWADRTAAHQVRVSTKKAVGEIVKGSDNVRKGYINANSQFVPQPASSSSSNETSGQGNKQSTLNV